MFTSICTTIRLLSQGHPLRMDLVLLGPGGRGRPNVLSPRTHNKIVIVDFTKVDRPANFQTLLPTVCIRQTLTSCKQCTMKDPPKPRDNVSYITRIRTISVLEGLHA